MQKRLPVILVIVGLAILYVAERVLNETPRYVALALGGIALLAGVALAVMRTLSAKGDARTAYTRLLVHYVLALVAVLLYFGQTKDVAAIPAGKASTIVDVLWPALLVFALAPAIAMERAVAATLAAGVVELYRVGAAARAARIVTLAVIAFAGINYAANIYNRKVDLSYFKTTVPSESTLQIIKGLTTPVDILLFYPVGNEVLENVKGYTDALAQASDNLNVRVVDQALDVEIAKELKVRNNGHIYIRANGHDENIKTDVELDAARTTLRNLDSEVQTRLIKALRPGRTAYFVNGHGERDFAQPTSDGRPALSELKALLESQGFKVSRLGLAEGLGNEVPQDATLVIIADPMQPYLAAERDSLQTYLAKGGRMLLMIDPDGAGSLTALTDTMGVKLGGVPVAQNKNNVRIAERGESPYFWASANAQSHASVSTLQQAAGRAPVVYIVAEKIERNPSQLPGMTLTPTLRSTPEAWEDVNKNGKMDEPGEGKKVFDLAYAIEGHFNIPTARADTPLEQRQPGDKARIIIVGDVDTAANGILSGAQGNALFYIDALHWLGGDDQITGPAATEKDVPIIHRKDKDTVWFYGTSFLVPAAVLGLGLGMSKRSRRSKREVKE